MVTVEFKRALVLETPVMSFLWEFLLSGVGFRIWLATSSENLQCEFFQHATILELWVSSPQPEHQ